MLLRKLVMMCAKGSRKLCAKTVYCEGASTIGWCGAVLSSVDSLVEAKHEASASSLMSMRWGICIKVQ